MSKGGTSNYLRSLIIGIIVIALVIALTAYPKPKIHRPAYVIDVDRRPIAICLTGDKAAFRDPYSGRIANILKHRGWITVSLDLPCHGDLGSDELQGWRKEHDSGHDFIGEFCTRASGVLTEVLARPDADGSRVCVYGISRGGFMALEWASRDPRISKVAGLAPVIELSALSEFHGATSPACVEQVARSIRCPVSAWVCEKDERVDEQAVYRLEKILPLSIHVMPIRQHSVTDQAFIEAADWLEK